MSAPMTLKEKVTLIGLIAGMAFMVVYAVLMLISWEVSHLDAQFSQEQLERAQQYWSRTRGADVNITNSIGMKMSLIPPGDFLMGSAEGEVGRSNDEHQHRVRITQPFYLGVYEVTQEEYKTVTGENSGEIISNLDTNRFPVAMVSWDSAERFCQLLSSRAEETLAGRIYRLPTEAEWEYACRAGTGTKWYSGDNVNDLMDAAWFVVNFDGGTHAIGEKDRNLFGLFDMHGNVAEWCQDAYDKDYYNYSPLRDPKGPPESSSRVVRGGAWTNNAGECRSASRSRYTFPFRAGYVGFRVVSNCGSQVSRNVVVER